MVRLLLLALSLTACGGAPSNAAPLAADAAGPRQLDVQGLATERAAGKVALLLDVRTEAEFASGHVPGAVNLPLDQLRAEAPALAEHRSKHGDTEVHVICQSGRRSMTASGQLAAWGFRPVNVQGGTGAWRAAGLPVD
jgi:rhodanese-related sulfurtransferase